MENNMTTTFIDQLASGQSSEAKDTLADMLSARAFEALDARKQDLAATLFGNEVAAAQEQAAAEEQQATETEAE
jgi:hypothetical protein